MTPGRAGEPLGILAGSGRLPGLLAEAASRAGRSPFIFGLAGDAEEENTGGFPLFRIRWGEVGRLERLLNESGCREVVFVGAVKRPEIKDIRPDFGALRLMPRVISAIRSGDDSALSSAARIFEEHGLSLIDPLSVAPELACPAGLIVEGREPIDEEEIGKAVEAARAIGDLDIGQAAVACGNRVVALEGAEGTNGLLQRVGEMRTMRRIPRRGGVMAKCMKPSQDPRLDIPTIGPETVERAVLAGLDGIVCEAGRTMLVGREETLDAFRRARLFLYGIRARS
ncbi:LpxI family protein [Afifella sp. IM 167]|uniref:LpxI family protein n=1 Tax=Afifella sp. IM 167 TaxID=2033586 RepID=UPI001CCA0E5F|nr:UDP-2,3-diacylglucosamine diphosphatase LpxI [Afifella sp. IM 167]MBZ8132306.1 phosphatidate cytidylyltransferase [Afifella sp. IM 167]